MEDDLLRQFVAGPSTHLLEAVCYGCCQTWIFEGEREKVKAWYRRWAPFSREGLLQMLETGTRKERLCALFSLGRLGYAEDRALLRAYLHSPQVGERWASAIVLWDQRARGILPVLQELVCDVLQTLEGWVYPGEEGEEDYGWTTVTRLQMLRRLAMGRDSEVIPLLSETLRRCWEAERRLDELLTRQPIVQEKLFAWEDLALYGLGQFQVWDPSLAWLPAGRLRVAQVIWTLGTLHAHEAVPDICLLMACPNLLSSIFKYVTGEIKSLVNRPPIPEALRRAGAQEPMLSMEDVKAALGRFFGLSAEQQEDLLAQFPSDCSIRLRETPDFLLFSKYPPGSFRLPEAELYQMWIKDFSLTGKAYDIRPPRREGEQEEWAPDPFADE